MLERPAVYAPFCTLMIDALSVKMSRHRHITYFCKVAIKTNFEKVIHWNFIMKSSIVQVITSAFWVRQV